MQTGGLSDKRDRFCREYLADFNATQAATRAGYSPKTANQQGARLLAVVNVAARLAELQANVAKRLEITADDITSCWWKTATAEPNELISYRIGACRHCHNADHAYQWRDEAELTEAECLFDAKYVNVKAETQPMRPNEDGGFGYNSTRPPHPDCTRCDGLGQGFPVIADTTQIGKQGRLLYNGIKITSQGTEGQMADRQKALEHVARQLGLMKDRVDYGITDPLAALLRDIAANGSAAPIRTAAADDEGDFG